MRSSIERLFAGSYLELYGRKLVPGWTVWGNEIPRDRFEAGLSAELDHDALQSVGRSSSGSLAMLAAIRRAVDKPFDHGHNYMSAPIHGLGPVVV